MFKHLTGCTSRESLPRHEVTIETGDRVKLGVADARGVPILHELLVLSVLVDLGRGESI